MIDTDVDTIAALSAKDVRLTKFVELALDGDVFVRFCTAGTDLRWQPPSAAEAVLWNGKGSLIGVELPDENLELASGIGRITISAVASDVISLLATQRVRGRRISGWIATYTEAGALVSTPFKRLDGKMNSFVLEDDPRNARGVLTYQTRIAALLKAPNTYWTNADQKALYPTDDGFKFAEITAARTLGYGPRR